MRRALIGSILEVPTKKGLAYAQITHRYTAPPVWGPLVRVFKGFLEARPKDLAPLAFDEVHFSTFLHVAHAARLGYLEILDRLPIAQANAKFPIFKSTFLEEPSGETSNVWWLWNGEQEWRVESLTEFERNYPNKEIPSPDVFVSRIGNGWTNSSSSWT